MSVEYERWLEGVPSAVTSDSLWRMRAYRMALFAADVGWTDVTTLLRDRRTVSLSDQMYRALGSISANIAEGYSRGTGRDRARFYEYALGSARESRDWYYKARHILGDQITDARLDLMSQVIRLLLVMVPNQRSAGIREDTTEYITAG